MHNCFSNNSRLEKYKSKCVMRLCVNPLQYLEINLNIRMHCPLCWSILSDSIICQHAQKNHLPPKCFILWVSGSRVHFFSVWSPASSISWQQIMAHYHHCPKLQLLHFPLLCFCLSRLCFEITLYKINQAAAGFHRKNVIDLH